MLINIPFLVDKNSQEMRELQERIIEQDQVLSLLGMTWKDFEYFTDEEYLGYRISYRDGEITIVSPGRNHERIVQVINRLIVAYCEKFNILDFPFGSTTLKHPPSVGKEPDISFAFEVDKDIPDLAVEVVFSSGGIADLEKYRILGIKEVWLWQNNEMTFYLLENNSYRTIETSNFLPKISASNLVSFVNRGFVESPQIIKADFIKQFN